MIDVQPYIDKLELLKEYMEVSIEMNASNKDYFIDLFWLYEKCGVLIRTGTMAIPSFTEYINMKHAIK